jgi:protein-L-isoaspartate(D-aspartate) O-methyltransferase
MVAWRTRFLTLAVAAATGCTSQPPPSLLLPSSPVEESASDGGGALTTGAAQATVQATAAGELDRELADTDELRAEREALVEGAIASAVDDERIIEAFRTVPRHAFVPTDVLERAYGDFALPIEAGQTISQPSLVALMTELVEIDSGDRVLEVGTGSGFQAAILRQLTDEVYSVEIIPELSGIARSVLERLGYGDIEIERRDGYLGWPEAAPFDAIVVTAAPDHLPRPLVDQLSPDGGRMVIPIGPVGDVQTLWLVTRNGEDVAMEEVLPVLFVPLTREEP